MTATPDKIIEAVNMLHEFDEAEMAAALDIIVEEIRNTLVVDVGDKKTDYRVYVWNGKRYEPAGAGGIEKGILRGLAILRKHYEDTLAKTGDDDKEALRASIQRKISKIASYANTIKRRCLEATIITTKSTKTQLDADITKINLQNGEYDSTSHVLRSHDKTQRHTMIAPFEHDETATGHKFTAQVEYMWPNTETRDYVLEGFSIAVFGGGQEERKIYYLWGQTARNGKTTLMQMITTALGEYATWLDSRAFSRYRARNATQPELLAGVGKRIVVIDEPAKEDLDSSGLKNVANFADVALRGLYERETKLRRWTATCFLLCNVLPPLDTKDAGNMERVVVIPVKRRITNEMIQAGKRPPEYAGLTYGEYVGKTEAAGIFNILVEYYKRYQERGHRLPMPPEVEEATKEYIYQGNAVARYVDTYYVKDPEGVVNAAAFNEGFKEYCINELGYDEKKVMLPQTIREAMAALGFDYKVIRDTRTGLRSERCYVGLSQSDAILGELRKEIKTYMRLAMNKQATTEALEKHFVMNNKTTPEKLHAVLAQMREVGEIIEIGGGLWGAVD